MTDISLTYRRIIGEIGIFDVGLSGADLETDDGLRTAVIISLFSDRRANEDDDLPGGSDDPAGRRGWWGDTYAAIDGDRIGSRLWLLSREKQIRYVLSRAQEYAEEALQWLIEDGVAQAVNVTTEFVRQGVLGLGIEIVRPDKSTIDYNFEYLWETVNVVPAS